VAAWSPLNSSAKELASAPRVGHSDRTKETHPMRGILLWLIGIPIPIIILLWLFGVLH
jgi:hypothetical protein